MVLSVEDMYILVADGVVELSIDYIQQADNLWELIAQVLNEPLRR